MFGQQNDQQTLNQAAANQPQADWTPPPALADGQDELTANTLSSDDSNQQQSSQSDNPDPDDVHQSTVSAPIADNNDLLDIKQQALHQLSPIVTHLDQSPEDKFQTLMMMIQASDNQSLLKQAYEAAQQITDEKQKAQALLDIVNEVNYFTHQGQQE